MFLQAAIDAPTIEEAETLLTRYASIPEIDVVEIGTPLISHYGVRIVDTFLRYYDVSQIYADLKLVDFPSIELRPYMDVGVMRFSAMAILTNTAFEVLRRISEDSAITIFVSTFGYPLDCICDRVSYLVSAGFRNIICHGGGTTEDEAFADLQQRAQPMEEKKSTH